ncbi:MAG: GIY-YIG nuclease family protein [Psychroflexus sp.]|nr:GIY-YIG nuclease family protein [Psychroflexus sp.]
MEEHVVYVLKSLKHPKHYVGYSTNLISRFKSHNHLGKKGFTTRYRPWCIVHIEFFDSKKEALKREKFLKSGKGREWMKTYIADY